MNTQTQIHVIFNPAAAGGKARRNKDLLLRELTGRFGTDYRFSETSGKHDASEIARRSVDEGCGIIVAAGGDGTVNEVVNGILMNGPQTARDVKLGILSIGTGQGFAQSIGLPRDLKSQVGIISSGHANVFDLGVIRMNDGSAMCFVNEFQLGIGATLVANASSFVKKLLGKYTYALEAVMELFSYEAQGIEFCINGMCLKKNLIGMVIANGAFTGGGMKLAPDASLCDGMLNVILINDMPIYSRLKSFSKIYSGSHIRLNSFQSYSTSRIEFESVGDLQYEADGEPINRECISAEILPSALRVLS